MKKLFFSLLLLGVSIQVEAQTTQSNDAQAHTAYLKQLSIELNGTYQVQMINTRALPTFDMELLVQVKNKRLQSDTLYIPVSEIQRIMVLPKDVIEDPNFQGVGYVEYVNLPNE